MPIKIMLLLLLFLTCRITTSSASLHSRVLQDADCGQIIGTITSDEVRSIGKSFLSQFLTTENDLLQRSTNVVFLTANSNLNIVKLCASCQDHSDWYYERNSLVFPGYHAIYCDENDRNTYEARASAIALIPQYDSTTTHGLPLNLKLRTFFTMPPTRINDDGSIMAPSDNFVSMLSTWRSNSTSLLGTDFFATYLPGMAAASAGSIALFPDYLSSKYDNIGRTIFRKRSYEHATAVSYLALERYVMDTSGKCTLLDKAVTIYGNDVDAAYGATVATLVLQRFGVACLGVFLSTGLLDLPIMIQDAMRNTSMTNQTSPDASNMKLWIQLAAHTISSADRQFDTDIKWIADQYKDELRLRYDPESVTVDSNSSDTGSVAILSATNLPGNVSALFHPTVVEALGTYNSSEWDIDQKDDNCERYDSLNTTVNAAFTSNTTNSTTLYEKIICQLRAHYTVYNILLGQADRPWISNISACYSNMDEIISGTIQYENLAIAQDDKFVTKYWKRYTQPIGLDTLAITNQDHSTSVQLCTVAPLLFLTLDGHRPVNMESWANFAPPLTSEESLQCTIPGTPPVSPSGDIPAPTPVNPTIVAQPSSALEPGDSNPTIVSKPTPTSPNDSNPTIVAQPADASPSKDVVIEGTPTSNEDSAIDEKGKEPNSNSNGVSSRSTQGTICLIATFVVIFCTII